MSDDDDDSEFDDVPLSARLSKKKKKKKKKALDVASVPNGASSNGHGNGKASSALKKKKRKLIDSDDGHDSNNDSDFQDSKPLSAVASNGSVKKKKMSIKARPAQDISPKKNGHQSSSPAMKRKNNSRAGYDSSDSEVFERKPKTKPNRGKVSTKSVAATGSKTLKKMDKMERLSNGMKAHLWWEAPDPPTGCQWTTMEHAGVSFPDPYEPHNIRMKYDGEPVVLTPPQEEAATFFAAMDPDGMHLGNPKTAPIFIKNFFADFKGVLGKGHVIRSFDKCDFSPIRRHLDEQKLIKKAITDSERKVNKNTREQSQFLYGFCLVDGHVEKVGNFNMEPPGAFRGRGEHPKMGKLKSRVDPEQVAVNVSFCAPVPRCPVPGHAWGDLRHDPGVMWLANWKENINGQVKYMQLAAQSSFKGKSDRSKYNKAARLCEKIDGVRKSYKKKLKNKDSAVRQLATAMWVIDRLALRVGGEKDTEEEADTVGCCSLRCEHLRFDPNDEGEDNREIELEFLGKDSMLFKQTIDFNAAMYNDDNGMGTTVYDNFKRFTKRKKSTEEVFDSLTPSVLNTHLKEIMEGLTAKVFRTYNASKTLQDELLKTEREISGWDKLAPADKVVEYNNANRQVAILCNHQKTVSKAQETQLESLGGKLEILKKQKKILKAILKRMKKTKSESALKIPIKDSDKKRMEKVQRAADNAKKAKESAVTDSEKIAASAADEKAKALKKRVAVEKFEQAHLWEKVPTVEQVCKRIQTWGDKITKMEMDLKHKDDNKEVSLGTSKINYMDPRISVAWCKRNEVPIEKIFSKTLRDKFNWAMAVPPDWEFNAIVGKQI